MRANQDRSTGAERQPLSVNLNQYREEVESGLQNEIGAMDLAQERQSFYDYDGFRYEKRFRRDTENSFDFQGRSHRASGFLHQCVGVLCRHLYSPGPSRRWDDDSGDKILQRVYADNLINSLLHECDKLSTLNDRVAIQIDAGKGDLKLKPITYRVWGREQHCVWCDPNNANEPEVVCTIDKFDNQRRARLWSDAEVWTFLSKKFDPDKPSEGRVLYLQTKEPHDYGCLPYTFWHYELPIRSFDGVVSIGRYLWGAEIHIDDRLSLMDESIKKYINPIPTAAGMPDGWKPVIEPGRFINLPRVGSGPNADGTYSPGEFAKLEYLSTLVDVAGSWDDLDRFGKQALAAASIPENQVRMEQIGVASGISLMVEQEPLLKRAENRREMAKVYETDLGRRTLTCFANHYGRAARVVA